MRNAISAVWLAVVLLVVGCAADAPRPRPNVEPQVTIPAYPRDQVVLQLDHGGGFWMPEQAHELVPEVTLWGDGQIVFTTPDGTIRQGRLDAEAVGRLLGQATFLYDLADDYQAVTHTDDATAFFTVYTDRGRKTVQVYGLNPKLGPVEGEPFHEILTRLRDLWAKAQSALPAGAPAMVPNVVWVSTFHSESEATADWPAELKGRLAGVAAQRAWELAGAGPARTFRVDGRAQRVLAVPMLPRPYSWEEDPIGLPNQVTGRNDDRGLFLDAVAERRPDDSYKVTVTLANKSQEGIDLLFNCGSLLWWEGLKPPAPNVDRVCPDVYSQLLEPGQTHAITATLAAGAIADRQALAVAVRHQRGGEPVQTLLTHLRRPLP